MKRTSTAILLFSLLLSPLVRTQTQSRKPSEEQDDEKLVVGTNEVLLDAVIKDKKGHTIKDLNPSDIEVYEDGVRQTVQSFRIVSRGPTSQTVETSNGETANNGSKPATTRTEAASPLDMKRIGAVGLVFDRLSPNARNIARQAAYTYLNGGLREDDFIGVFGIDLSLHVLQTFTNKEDKVKKAIDLALSHSSSTYNSNAEKIADLADQQAALQSTIDSGGGSGGAGNDPSGSIGAAAVEQAFATMTKNILEGFENLEQNQQGYATTDGLLAIINQMGRLPGRKALVFFSEGVAVPTVVMSHFKSVISTANRNNVSIYSVDAAGLRAVSADSQAGHEMTVLGQARARQAGSPTDSFGSMMKDLERNEDLMNSNPDSALLDLATQTGGILIANTNEPGTRLRQVDDDLHTYYLLSYTPKNQNYDGKFRQVSMKVNRPGVEVQTRKGYYAISREYGSEVQSYEAPALAILSGRPPTGTFTTHAGAFVFPESARPGLVPIEVEIPSGAINFSIDKQKNAYHTDFSVVVLIKDDKQRVVKKLSNQYLINGPLDKLDGAKKGKILFYREAQLDPGRYTMASVVYDALSGQSSTDTATINVPASGFDKLRLSNIVLVKRAERLGATEQAANPFRFGEVLLYPNLGESVQKSASKDMTLFVTVYPPRGNTSTPKLNLEIAQEGHGMTQLSYLLPAADQRGRIQYACVIPLEKFKPGEFEVKLTVQSGQESASQSETFTLSR